AFAAAVRRRDEHIAAILAWGPKRDGRGFNRRDRWLVMTLTSAAAAAWNVEPPAENRMATDQPAFECPDCGLVGDSAPLQCSCACKVALAALPRRVGRNFIVERRLGAGGMGVVYLARDAALDRQVALKTLPSLSRGNVARLRDEARAMAALNHESLATLYGLEIWRHTPVLVVEYFPGGTLACRLSDGPWLPAAVVDLGVALLRALDYMHARDVLHRDLKPTNIAFTATGAPKLLDFGLATLRGEAFGHGRGDPERIAGTPGYLPP